MRASTQAGGRSGQGGAALIPQPTVTAAAPDPPLATAAAVLPPPPPHPQHLPVVPLDPLPLEERGGAAAPLPTRLDGVAAATAPTDIAVSVVRRAGIGDVAVLKDQAATRKTAVILESAGAAEVDPDPERETGEGPEPEIAAVVAETEKRKKKGKRIGKGAVMAEIAVTVVAANINRRPLAKMLRGGGKGVTAMKKTRKKRIGTGIKSLTKRETN